jgi:hypothetical protein
MSQDQILEYLERAHNFGCFEEVIKLIRQGSDSKLIEVILEKAEEKMNKDLFSFDDIFGCD